MAGVFPIAVDLVATRRVPSHVELMQSDDAILEMMETQFAPSTHGLSTILMASCFETSFLAAKLSDDQARALCVHFYSGVPLRSAFDGMDNQGQPATHVATVDVKDETDAAFEEYLSFFDFDAMDVEVEEPEICTLEEVAGDFFDQTMCPQTSSRRLHWKAKEDEFIINYCAKHGPAWRAMSLELAKTLGSSRSDDALRNRFARISGDDDTLSSSSSATQQTKSARPFRKQWTLEEDQFIMTTVFTWGTKSDWQALGRVMPHRTPHSIRNRFTRLAMRRARNSANPRIGQMTGM